jgi:hypothetical protein
LWFNLQDFFLFFVSSSSPDLSNCGKCTICLSRLVSSRLVFCEAADRQFSEWKMLEQIARVLLELQT